MKFYKKTLKNVPLDGKTVLVRADYNVPLNKDGSIADDYRVTQSVPTIQYLLDRKCKVVICSHLGRPEGKVTPEFSLEPIAAHLSELLKQPVGFVSVSVGDQVKVAVKQMQGGTAVLLENLRFDPREEKNDHDFAKQLAKDSCADYFVQDGFGVVHRAHASTASVTEFLPSVAGLLLEKEVTTITAAMQSPKRPLVAILGGAKVSDKIEVIERFVDIADQLIIGGAMANTFFKFHGLPIGKSLYEPDLDLTVNKIYDRAFTKLQDKETVDEFILLPTDVAVAKAINPSEDRTVTPLKEVNEDEYILDMGPKSIDAAVQALQGAGTVVWNGTMGYAELEQFAHGSARIALALAQQPDTISIIGGGDTADFVLNWDAHNGASFTHVSTGGGASLELMAGKKLPGIEALLNS